MSNLEILHNKFNKRNEQSSPIRVKGFTRKLLFDLCNELGFSFGVEVGTSQGLNAVTICNSIPNVKLFCVDPYMKYHWKHSEEEHERCFELAHERLDPFGVTIFRQTSMEAIKRFSDNSLDFVYIDGNHEFDFVMQDLIEWGKKVKQDGIISGHDFYRFRRAGVVDAVEAYTKAHQVNEWFICDYFLKERNEPETSFFWVKNERW